MDTLKEINGKHYMECQVVMLGTNDKSNPSLYYSQHINACRKECMINSTPQHLYFLSSEEIKEGDWSLYEYCKATKVNIPMNGDHKIIATTDTSLKRITGKVGSGNGVCFPYPSPEFIKAYIEAYNKGEKIEKVLVEMEKFDFDEEWSDINGAYETFRWRLKLNSSNEITIKKVKNSWTREELPSILQEYLDWCHFMGYITPQDWLKENL